MAEKVSRRLVILSAAAIAAVYAAGFQETRAADARLGGAIASVNLPTATLRSGDAIGIATSSPVATIASGPTAGPATPTAAPANAVSPGRGAPSAATAPTAVPTAPKASAATIEATSVAPVATSTTAVKLAATTTPAPSATGLKDGVYQGAGTSRRGGIGVMVTVQNGRIARVAITQSTTQYPVSRIASLPSEVVARQSAQVDLVSGATFSGLAFQGAVQQALAEAKVA